MSTFSRSRTSEILLLLQARLVSVTEFPAYRVIISVLDASEVPHFGATQDIILTLGMESQEPADEGGGRYVDFRTREVTVSCRTRVALDRPDGDGTRLTDASLGHLALEDTVYNAVKHWLAISEATDAVSCPGVVGSASKPRKDRDDETWISSSFPVKFSYLRDLDLTLAE